jgi:hypothetical protein
MHNNRHAVLPAALVCLFGMNIAFGTEVWLPISTSAPNITFMVDRTSLERTGALVQFREKMVYAKPEVRDEASGQLIKEKRVQRVMDCDERTQGVLSGAIYAEGGTFIVANSFDDALKTMVKIPPGSVAEEEFRLVCGPPRGTLFGVDFNR